MPDKITSRGVIGSFFHELQQNEGASWVGGTSMYFKSDQDLETYAWLGQIAAMREWIGKRHAKGFSENVITIRNKEYESTIEVPVKWLNRDKTSQLMIRIREQARRANSHWASLLSTLIIGGETGLCYDGQFFYDTDHSEGSSGTQSNDIAVDISAIPVTNHGTTTKPSVGEFQDAILEGCQSILGFVDDQGEPMNEDAKDFLVMVPTAFWKTTAAALGAPVTDGGDTNIIASSSMDGFKISYAVNPRLTWTDKFSVFRTDSDVSSFIRQEENGVQVGAIAEGSELEFNNKVHHYGISASRNVGYGYWQNACLVTLT